MARYPVQARLYSMSIIVTVNETDGGLLRDLANGMPRCCIRQDSV